MNFYNYRFCNNIILLQLFKYSKFITTYKWYKMKISKNFIKINREFESFLIKYEIPKKQVLDDIKQYFNEKLRYPITYNYDKLLSTTIEEINLMQEISGTRIKLISRSEKQTS